MTSAASTQLLREAVFDAELMALLWLLGEGGVPVAVIGDASLSARSAVAGALVSLTPGRGWVVIDADAEPPSAGQLAALLQGGVGLGLTLAVSDLKSMLDGASALSQLPEDGVRRLGVVVVLADEEPGLRCTSVHYLRPSELDGQGHIQRRPPAVLAAWDPDGDRYEHYAWGITPELATRVGRAQADLEDRQRDRASFLETLTADDAGAADIEALVRVYVEAEPERIPSTPAEPATPSPFQHGLTDPHAH
jgi:hypothetical protein